MYVVLSAVLVFTLWSYSYVTPQQRETYSEYFGIACFAWGLTFFVCMLLGYLLDE